MRKWADVSERRGEQVEKWGKEMGCRWRTCVSEEEGGRVSNGLIIDELTYTHTPKWHAGLGVRMLGRESWFRNLELTTNGVWFYN